MVAGLALWVAGFVGLFGYGYTAKSQRDAAAVDLSRVAIDDTVTVQVTDGGKYGVRLETIAGADRPDTVQRLIDAAWAAHRRIGGRRWTAAGARVGAALDRRSGR
ncbi:MULTISPECIES: hypothetical protein [unclassified Solwaraspora]|uniref:hypothetical protein n=1 Tax=unclassified Solwaraspora TaxID=2627926 RepID=UPI00248AA80E|nr:MULTISPECIES: hypothetical protein [unclassified Solwaraspora]WBB96865.1 hypothetical protein O7553_26940 [Solwaraspora sp. WMMA2059]WBC19230.1 hypothetical protein O7543_20425 [Solwaraspora sp. WMMA2080]WJK33341.1 hypothetical protein O7610_21990 [Solwaraspora sp. WMMA2065]